MSRNYALGMAATVENTAALVRSVAEMLLPEDGETFRLKHAPTPEDIASKMRGETRDVISDLQVNLVLPGLMALRVGGDVVSIPADVSFQLGDRFVLLELRSATSDGSELMLLSSELQRRWRQAAEECGAVLAYADFEVEEHWVLYPDDIPATVPNAGWLEFKQLEHVGKEADLQTAYWLNEVELARRHGPSD